MKHKLLYIPDARYMLFGDDDSHEIIEEGTFGNMKTGRITSNYKELFDAIMTWDDDDQFWDRNKLKYPISLLEFEIVEIK